MNAAQPTPPRRGPQSRPALPAPAVLAILVLLGSVMSGGRVAAEGPDTQFVRGYALLTGQGQPRDATRAAALFLVAANQGEPQSQYQLGAMFMDGLGLPRDEVWAHHWLTQALTSPALPPEARSQAEGRLKALARRLTSDQKRRLGIP